MKTYVCAVEVGPPRDLPRPRFRPPHSRFVDRAFYNARVDWEFFAPNELGKITRELLNMAYGLM